MKNYRETINKSSVGQYVNNSWLGQQFEHSTANLGPVAKAMLYVAAGAILGGCAEEKAQPKPTCTRPQFENILLNYAYGETPQEKLFDLAKDGLLVNDPNGDFGEPYRVEIWSRGWWAEGCVSERGKPKNFCYGWENDPETGKTSLKKREIKQGTRLEDVASFWIISGPRGDYQYANIVGEKTHNDKPRFRHRYTHLDNNTPGVKRDEEIRRNDKIIEDIIASQEVIRDVCADEQ